MRPDEGMVEPGAFVDATDGRLGSVEETVVRPETGELAYLVVRRGWSDQLVTVPAALIDGVPGRRAVRLRVTRDEALARLAGPHAPGDAFLARDTGGELRIPVVEERLRPVVRQVDLGELRVHKHVDMTIEAVSQALTRDDLVIERVPMNEALDEPRQPYLDGDWLVIPIMEEVLVVQKRLMLKEEVRVRKRQITEEQTVREAVRRERIELEDATRFGVAGLRDAAATSRLDPAECEPAEATPPDGDAPRVEPA